MSVAHGKQRDQCLGKTRISLRSDMYVSRNRFTRMYLVLQFVLFFWSVDVLISSAKGVFVCFFSFFYIHVHHHYTG